eukprot:TRINITY_DN4353_c0_g1_i1.p1 TRINITY_DN4353_c0_g1~~TRINITY_DN4353_c0_g1_i1.p1  ORF type:complete len:357 (+),score=78.78 TRINITY_DN4353_c0_g1_i1:85-1155(+)
MSLFSFGGNKPAGAPSFGTGTTGFSFGTPATNPAPATTGFSFGSPAPTTAPSTGFSFGSPASSTSSSSSLFPTTSSSLFPSSSSSLFPAASSAAPAANPAPILISDSSSENPERKLEYIQKSFDPQSPHCRFHYMLYNQVDPSRVSQFKRPNNVDPRLWQLAVQNNPKPDSLVPVQATGFVDLKKRFDEQTKANAVYTQHLQELENKMGALEGDELKIKHELEQCKQRHRDLAARLLQVMGKLEMVRGRGVPLLNEEILFQKKLESMARELNKPNQYSSRVAELASLARIHQQNPLQLATPSQLDPESLQQIYTFLENQRSALQHLTTTLKKDMADMQLVSSGLSQIKQSSNYVTS